ncbi:MAG: zinc ribbon domain-containing protein [Chloroflexi bacterium]|nr:zinc ribbon domain-containing protein [Chloroflexota bacterium]
MTLFGFLVIFLAIIGLIALVYTIVVRAGRVGRGTRPAVCPQCGNANPDGARFCQKCRTPVGNSIQQSAASQVTTASESRPGLCPQCGNANPDEAIFCQKCGTPVGKPTQKSDVPQPGMASESRPGLCPQCGKANPEQARFCLSCGAALQTFFQKPSVSQAVVSTQTTKIVAIIGAAVILVGFLTPWITISGWVSANISALDWIRGWSFGGETLDRRGEVYLALIGVLLAVVGAISALASPKTKARWATLILLGGIASILAAVWGIVDIGSHADLGVSGGYGYGVYLTLIGGLLSLGALLGSRRWLETLFKRWFLTT